LNNSVLPLGSNHMYRYLKQMCFDFTHSQFDSSDLLKRKVLIVWSKREIFPDALPEINR